MAKFTGGQTVINNAFYDTLGEDWYTAQDHPVALLRAENHIRAPWVNQQIKQHFGKPAAVLDIGCGAGFLSNYLASEGHTVFGVDLSESSLRVAGAHDHTGKACYRHGNAYNLPYAEKSFDVACAMDILEHVEKPAQLIREAARVLRPNGLFFFHTFNRNLLSYLIVIKGVDWFVRNAPKNLHVYHLFLKPSELEPLCAQYSLQVQEMRGFVPQPWRKAFWKMLLTGKVSEDFRFAFTRNLMMGYCGFAIQKSASSTIR